MGGLAGEHDPIALMIFLAKVLLSSRSSFLAAVEMYINECLILEVSSLSLSIMGLSVLVAPSRCSFTGVAMSETSNLSDKSVSRVATEHIDSSIVLGIFWALVIWSREVAKVLSMIGWCSRMSFLSSKNSWASLGVWISELSTSTCCVGWELVHKR